MEITKFYLRICMYNTFYLEIPVVSSKHTATYVAIAMHADSYYT